MASHELGSAQNRAEAVPARERDRQRYLWRCQGDRRVP
jgi:hypothetical protein